MRHSSRFLLKLDARGCHLCGVFSICPLPTLGIHHLYSEPFQPRFLRAFARSSRFCLGVVTGRPSDSFHGLLVLKLLTATYKKSFQLISWSISCPQYNFSNTSKIICKSHGEHPTGSDNDIVVMRISSNRWFSGSCYKLSILFTYPYPPVTLQ